MARAFRLQSVSTDREANTTTIGWTEAPRHTVRPEPQTGQSVRAAGDRGRFRQQRARAQIAAALLDHPASQTSPPVNPPFLDPPPYQADWDEPVPASFVPGGTTLDLDGVYNSILASPEIPGWAVVMAGDPPTGEIDTPSSTNAGAKTLLFHVTSARPVNQVDFTLNARVTRLTSKGSRASQYFLDAHDGGRRGYHGAATAAAAAARSLAQPLRSLAASIRLQPGQTVVVQGPSATDGTVVARSHVLNGPPAVTGIRHDGDQPHDRRCRPLSQASGRPSSWAMSSWRRRARRCATNCWAMVRPRRSSPSC